MLDFNFTEDQEILRETAREFAGKVIAKNIPAMMKNRRIPDEVFRGLAKMNYLGMNISEEYGGMNADAVTTGIVAEEIARADPTASIPVLFLVDNAWSYLISRYGSEELKKELLPKVVKGEAIVGIASTEPNFGTEGQKKIILIDEADSIFEGGHPPSTGQATVKSFQVRMLIL